MLNQNYLNKLPKNKLLAADRICEDYINDNLGEDARDVAYTLGILLEEELPKMEIIEGGGFGLGVITNLINFLVGMPSRNPDRKIKTIHRHVKALIAKATITDPTTVNRYLIELSTSETKEIDNLLRQIKDLIRESANISEDHKRRLLKISNALQSELDKQYSDYRVFLDGMVETSEAMGEAGENVKPVFDRIKELFGIVDRRRKLIEQIEVPQDIKQLPAPPKMLDSTDTNDDEPDSHD